MWRRSGCPIGRVSASTSIPCSRAIDGMLVALRSRDPTPEARVVFPPASPCCPRYRGLGVGTGLYGAVWGSARERGLDTSGPSWPTMTMGASRSPSDAVSPRRVTRKGSSSRPEGSSYPGSSPGRASRWSRGRSGRSSRAGSTRSCSRRCPTSRRGGRTGRTVRGLARARHARRPGDRPEATFVAVAGDEVIGYAKFSLSALHHDGPSRPDGRQAGLARPRRRTCAEGDADRVRKANGFVELRPPNDERNAPIRHLNEEFGYRPTVGKIYLRGPLA